MNENSIINYRPTQHFLQPAGPVTPRPPTIVTKTHIETNITSSASDGKKKIASRANNFSLHQHIFNVRKRNISAGDFMSALAASIAKKQHQPSARNIR